MTKKDEESGSSLAGLLTQDQVDEYLTYELNEVLSRTECNNAEARHHDAEAGRAKAIEHKVALEALSAEMDNRMNRIVVESAERREKEVLAHDLLNHVYNFGVQYTTHYETEISNVTVKACIETLTGWARNAPGCDIEIILNSEGGDIVAGFALVDFLRKLEKQGHAITITALGMAASMAAVVLQAATTRVMGKNAVMLLHEASFSLGESTTAQAKDFVKLIDLFHERILDIFCERSSLKRAAIQKGWERADWWMSAQTCLKNGFCDRITE